VGVEGARGKGRNDECLLDGEAEGWGSRVFLRRETRSGDVFMGSSGYFVPDNGGDAGMDSARDFGREGPAESSDSSEEVEEAVETEDIVAYEGRWR
jgi:hypothetical protein